MSAKFMACNSTKEMLVGLVAHLVQAVTIFLTFKELYIVKMAYNSERNAQRTVRVVDADLLE